ncbi:MAG TPA: hypothetical protein VMT99_04240 [Candidatus Paceibacterota bacterium]|nr:hypothetical protein [Candidatus Paceibacterota bacterium]
MAKLFKNLIGTILGADTCPNCQNTLRNVKTGTILVPPGLLMSGKGMQDPRRIRLCRTCLDNPRSLDPSRVAMNFKKTMGSNQVLVVRRVQRAVEEFKARAAAA